MPDPVETQLAGEVLCPRHDAPVWAQSSRARVAPWLARDVFDQAREHEAAQRPRILRALRPGMQVNEGVLK